MPLIKSDSKEAFHKNVAEMVHSGHPVKQAVAAAYSNQRGAAKDHSHERMQHEKDKYGK